MYYSAFGLLALVIHFIINFETLKTPSTRTKTTLEITYRRFLFSVMFYYITDILWGILYNMSNIPLIYIDTVLYYFAMCVSIFFWIQFVTSYWEKNNFFSKLLSQIGWLLISFYVLALIVNVFRPIMFYFGEDERYLPLPGRSVGLAIQVGLFLVSSLYSFFLTFHQDKDYSKHYLAIGISGLTITVFIILQALYPFIPYYAIGSIIGTCAIHSFVVAEERAQKERELILTRRQAYRDALTSVNSNIAYTEAKENWNVDILSKTLTEFGVIVFDVNNLKIINDNMGHKIGDQLIKSACSTICQKFKHSPVYRIGGDEFLVFLQNEDYKNRESLFQSYKDQMIENVHNNGLVVACGMAVFDESTDHDYNDVFTRADKNMYEFKTTLKAEKEKHKKLKKK
ncbi:MAG: GGDEF domain-containing protein [Lachnospiraceae bacterium]|nr:GGDEF domain-containing protein [Lachnospiraceae bacterium]